MSNLDKALEWADRIRNTSVNGYPTNADCYSAAEIIQSLPDQWVDVEKVLEIADDMSNWSIPGMLDTTDSVRLSQMMDGFIDRLNALIAPKLPTLADMTPEERKACQWMQCKVETDDEDVIGVIRRVWSNSADVIFQSGRSIDPEYRRVTPLPDLPKLEWPGSAPDDVAYATGGVLTAQDVVDECRAVRKERAVPRPEDVPPSEPWLIEVEGEKYVGTRHAGNTAVPWSVAALDGSFAGDYNDSEITLIHKLVPEPPALPEGMRLADHEEYGRVVVSPKVDTEGEYMIFFPRYNYGENGSDYEYAHKSVLNFLDGTQ